MSRKYSQRGYREDERDDTASRHREPAAQREGPRGRGVGRPRVAASRCARCGTVLDEADSIGPESRCGGCGADLHTCTNCAHFDTGAVNECRAGVEVRVAKKASRNDCSAFEARRVAETASERETPGDARAAFDALFDI